MTYPCYWFSEQVGLAGDLGSTNEVLIPFVKGVTTRGGRMTTEIAYNDEINNINKEPPKLPHDKSKESRDVILLNEPQKIKETISQPSVEKLAWVMMNERCSAILLNKLPCKEKDPGSFTVPCHVGDLHINNALANLGASISLMPYTTVGGDEVIFDMDQSMKKPPSKDNECYSIDELDDTIHKEAQELLEKDQSDLFLLKDLERGVNQMDLDNCSPIPITPEDQEKMTFTCPYRTFAYRRMSFALCNAPATFQRCMTSIFHDMVEDFMEVFMDDFLVFGNSFDNCLVNLDKMLARCEETNLVLNWEKCHFIVREGIVLEHKIYGSGIEIKDKTGVENLVVDKLSRLGNLNMEVLIEREIGDEFPDEHLMMLKAKPNDGEPWKVVPIKWSADRRKRFYSQVKNYIWDEPDAFRLCADNVIRRCVARTEILKILAHCHSGPTGGHYSASVTGMKVYVILCI
ncbi:reverse transcriptase domain-containing protein [Tanacetum coccineum]